MNREFAFGRNATDGCACPAVTAGFSPGTDLTTEAAEWYDEYLREHTDEWAGTVPEDRASAAWLSILYELEDRRHYDPELYEESYLAGREVAKELGWL